MSLEIEKLFAISDGEDGTGLRWHGIWSQDFCENYVVKH